ncbi:hypothetical protein B566_EDAN010394 [Ephemera danica]|nr:hypothetical protein B566_EDAN010394 [Ephemera danica]
MQADMETGGKFEKLLNCIKTRLKLPAMETSQLVHEYYCDRLAEQENQTPVEKDCSYVTLKLWFIQNKLHVHLENTWVKPKEKNGLYDLYMKINIVPACKVHKHKSKIHKKTTAAILNESFEIVLTEEQISRGDSLVHLELLDHKRRDTLGEAFVPFSSVQSGGEEPVSQMLPITNPSSAAGSDFPICVKVALTVEILN